MTALALALGVTEVPTGTRPAILLGEDGERVHRIAVWELRLPGVLAGAALALSGALLQDALRNDLAEPGSSEAPAAPRSWWPPW